MCQKMPIKLLKLLLSHRNNFSIYIQWIFKKFVLCFEECFYLITFLCSPWYRNGKFIIYLSYHWSYNLFWKKSDSATTAQTFVFLASKILISLFICHIQILLYDLSLSWLHLFTELFCSGATAKCHYTAFFITPIGEIILYYIFYSSSNFQITCGFSLGQAWHKCWFVIIEFDKQCLSYQLLFMLAFSSTFFIMVLLSFKKLSGIVPKGLLVTMLDLVDLNTLEKGPILKWCTKNNLKFFSLLSPHPVGHDAYLIDGTENFEKSFRFSFALNKLKKPLFSRTQHIYKCIPLLFYPKLTYLMNSFEVIQDSPRLTFFSLIMLILENMITNTDNPERCIYKYIYIFVFIYLSLYTLYNCLYILALKHQSVIFIDDLM